MSEKDPKMGSALSEISIEICGPQNECVMFDPTQNKLRGRWSHHVSSGRSMHESLSRVQAASSVIPGMCVAITPQAASGRIFDPLRETEAGRDIWKRIAPILKAFENFFENGRPVPQKDFASLTADDIKEWLFRMRQLVDTGMAVLTPESAPLPTLAEIVAMPGKVLSSRSTITREENRTYMHNVPVAAGATGTAGGGAPVGGYQRQGGR